MHCLLIGAETKSYIELACKYSKFMADKLHSSFCPLNVLSDLVSECLLSSIYFISQCCKYYLLVVGSEISEMLRTDFFQNRITFKFAGLNLNFDIKCWNLRPFFIRNFRYYQMMSSRFTYSARVARIQWRLAKTNDAEDMVWQMRF